MNKTTIHILLQVFSVNKCSFLGGKYLEVEFLGLRKVGI